MIDLEGTKMKPLTTYEDVYSLLHAPSASAALGAAITTGLLWMLAERPMNADEVAQALNIPGKRGHYWLQNPGNRSAGLHTLWCGAQHNPGY